MENKLYLKFRYHGFVSELGLEVVDIEQHELQLSCKTDLLTLRNAKNLKSLCEKYSVIINSKGESIIMTNSKDFNKDAKNLAKFAFKLNSFK